MGQNPRAVPKIPRPDSVVPGGSCLPLVLRTGTRRRGRSSAAGRDACRELQKRTAELQPLRRSAKRDRVVHPPDPGAARPPQPRHPGARAVAGGRVEDFRGREDLDADLARRCPLFRRRAVHLGRRAVQLPGDLRPEAQQPARDERARWRRAAHRARARRADVRDLRWPRRTARAWRSSTRCRSIRGTSCRPRSTRERFATRGARRAAQPISPASVRSC